MDSHPMVARPGVLCGLDRRPGPLPECRPIATHHAGAREGVFQRGAYVQLDRRAGFASPQNCAGAINPCTGIPVKNPSWQFVGEMTLKGTADHHACIPNSILGSMLAEAICDVTIRLCTTTNLYTNRLQSTVAIAQCYYPITTVVGTVAAGPLISPCYNTVFKINKFYCISTSYISSDEINKPETDMGGPPPTCMNVATTIYSGHRRPSPPLMLRLS
jgi:hypothetical protein